MAKTSDNNEYKDKLRECAILNEIVGLNLRRLRESSKTNNGCDVSVPWLSHLTALSRASLWHFESGRSGMTVATLVRLKEAYGCTWDDLLDGCESKIVKERKRFTGEVKRKKL